MWIGEEKNKCEVFQDICKKFVIFESLKINIKLLRAVSIGSEIVVIQDKTDVFLFYDVDKDELSEKSCEVTYGIKYLSCMKIAQM